MDYPHWSDSFENSADEATKIITVEFDTATATSGDQAITIGDATFTLAGSEYGSDAEAAAGLRDLINSDTLIAQRVSATVSGDTKLVIESVLTGDDFNFSYSGTGGTATSDGSGDSQLPAESGNVPYGFVVARSANDPTPSSDIANALEVRLPSDGADTPYGIVGGSEIRENPDGASIPTYERGESMAALLQGTIWGVFEDAPNINDSVYWRHTADGNLDRLGILASASGTGLNAFTDARVVSQAVSYGDETIARVQLQRL